MAAFTAGRAAVSRHFQGGHDEMNGGETEGHGRPDAFGALGDPNIEESARLCRAWAHRYDRIMDSALFRELRRRP